MAFTLPPLPYPTDALVPKGFSVEQLTFHYEKHHRGYVTKLNAAAAASPPLAALGSVEAVIRHEPEGGAHYNLAAQIYNHTFYWNGLSPRGGGLPSGALAARIEHDFGSFEAFREKFTAAATSHFGSGWAWLVQESEGKTLKVVSTHDAGCPLSREGMVPLLACDVWEHAYYIDYRNDRASYIESFWSAVNWDFVASNLLK
eukprot:CAMPEP_0201493122 /NCGR_PEP_ID=MMETSP0151_2-20130828/36223_1 /ASSEMBLY_ACC=CAM_ASM_000257 /TAXON_ID=200890 /ORGANISM="Paramoeba atlantica, Strain 621/1 / CCAP 1560/9" /LENGTH=200 /DNA_ID=CAMNT_0047880305 /DNA_START=62 /DNA_END=664 /DNA_ORIENTATION=+